jgi:hypothetical protein
MARGMTSVKLRCRCGSLAGSFDLARPSRVHVVCHCGDCEAYARQIGNVRANQIVQATPAQVKLLIGKENLRCLRLTQGGLTRWFAACCMTPLANTTRHAWMPFVGVMKCVLDTNDEALLGPPTPVNGGHPTPWSTILRSLQALFLGLVFRSHRPNAFFDDKGHPVVRPEIVAGSARLGAADADASKRPRES